MTFNPNENDANVEAVRERIAHVLSTRLPETVTREQAIEFFMTTVEETIFPAVAQMLADMQPQMMIVQMGGRDDRTDAIEQVMAFVIATKFDGRLAFNRAEYDAYGASMAGLPFHVHDAEPEDSDLVALEVHIGPDSTDSTAN